MVRAAGLAAVAAALMVLTAPGAAHGAAPACADAELDAATTDRARVAGAVICEVNRRRTARGLRKLTSHPKLGAGARSFVARLAETVELDHAPGGKDARDRARAAGYKDWRSVRENLAFGRPTARTIVDLWMSDGPHRRTLLLNRRDIGVGYADGYWVLLVGRMPRKA